MKTLGSNVNLFLGVQSQLKILHWQTKQYARHMAFGSTYDELDELIDAFVEGLWVSMVVSNYQMKKKILN